MKLTPIRVRGKHKRPVRDAGTSATAQDTAMAPDGSSAPAASPSASRAKRPRLASKTLTAPVLHRAAATDASTLKSPLDSSLASSPASTPPSSSFVSPRPSPPAPARRTRNRNRPVPFDRRFPLEIIERIFILSQNLDLPQCSPRLGWMLSNRRTLMEMVLAAFGRTWKQHFGIPNVRMINTLSYSVADRNFQSAILASPWAKMDLLLDAQHLWLQRNKCSQYTHLLELHNFSLRDITSKIVLNPARLYDLLETHPWVQSHGFEDAASDPRLSKLQPRPKMAGEDYCDLKAGDVKATATSIYPCFALEQFFFLHAVLRERPPHLQPDETPLELISERVRTADEMQEVGYARINLADQMAVFDNKIDRAIYQHIIPNTRIPEWLLLAGGPYVDEADATGLAQASPASRRAVRARLRSAFDTLFWMVQNGIDLRIYDSWEVTMQGFKYLLQVDVNLYEDDEYEESENALKGEGNGRSDIYRLTYTTDTLVVGMLALFSTLGVFSWHWRAPVLGDAMQQATDRAEKDPAFRHTQTYKYLQRIAQYRADYEF